MWRWSRDQAHFRGLEVSELGKIALKNPTLGSLKISHFYKKLFKNMQKCLAKNFFARFFFWLIN